MESTTKKLNQSIKVSLLAAIAVILMYFEIPIIPAFSWLKLDLSELPVLMGAFAYGPMVGVILEALKILLFFLLRGTQTGGIGELANFLVGISLIVPASYIYKTGKSKKSIIIGMVVGAISMEIVGIIANVYLLLPAYGLEMDSSALLDYVTIGLLPFNGIKALLVSIVTYILYDKVSNVIFKDTINRKKKIIG